MVAVVQSATNERRFCWEQLLRTNRLFRISQVFAPMDRAGQLLPLYALFAAVEEVCSEHSDEEVARRKLGWWRSECAQLGVRHSNHPILRELEHSGARQVLRPDSLERLFGDAEARLDPAPLADLDELQERCRQLSQPQIELELSLWGSNPNTWSPVEAIAATGGLAQLVREAARRTDTHRYWWLPLSLLAHHGLSRADINRDPRSAPVRALFTDLIDACLDGFARQRLAHSREGVPEAVRHLFVMGQLQGHALRRARAGGPGQLTKELNRVGLAQLFQAWRAARKISRPL
jgi:phytoene synthase